MNNDDENEYWDREREIQARIKHDQEESDKSGNSAGLILIIFIVILFAFVGLMKYLGN